MFFYGAHVAQLPVSYLDGFEVMCAMGPWFLVCQPLFLSSQKLSVNTASAAAIIYVINREIEQATEI